jgi:riboflavin kinase/FMN adenylyltransferase
LTFGVFDGVHAGHAHMLKHIAERAKQLKLPSAVIVLRPRPNEALGLPARPYLTSANQSVRLIRAQE